MYWILPSATKADCLCHWSPGTIKTWLHTSVHWLLSLHIQPKNQTPHWAFRAALCTVPFKECQRAFTSPLLSEAIDSILFCLLSKKQRRLLLHCVCTFVCVRLCVWVHVVWLCTEKQEETNTHGKQIHTNSLTHSYSDVHTGRSQSAYIFFPLHMLLKYREHGRVLAE